MSWIQDLRDQTAAAITALALGPIVTTSWVPEFQRDKVVAAELNIFPVSRTTTNASRGCKQRTAVIGVFYIDPMKVATRDAQAEAAQLIGDKLEELLNTKVNGYSITKVEQSDIVDQSEWRAQNAITTTYLLTLELIGM
jgi:hypothetical protein